MASPAKFKPVYRRFLYLDGVEVLNGLSGVLGGEEAERLETVVKELGGDAGANFSVLGVGINFGARSNRQARQEVRLRATIHSQVDRFIRELDRRDGIADVDDSLRDVNEGMLVRFRARLGGLSGDKRLLMAASPPTFLDRLLGWDPVAAAQGERVRALGGKSRVVAVVDVLRQKVDVHIGPVALELRPGFLLIDRLDEFARTATVVGQAEWKAANSEQLVKRQTSDAECLTIVGGRANYPEEEPSNGSRDEGEIPPSYRWIKRKRVKKARTLAEARSPGALPISEIRSKNVDDEELTLGVEQVTLGVRPLLIFR
ncbi:MAG: DUF6414 family protein [Solirubrobacterales bacterium]